MAHANAQSLPDMDDVQHMGRQAAAHPAAQMLAKAGYAAKGLVYVLIGALTVRLALGTSATAPDRQQALYSLYSFPLGKVTLAVVALGLLGYGLWTLAVAAFDLDHRGTKAKAIVERIGYAAVGISYLGLGLAAGRLAAGLTQGGGQGDAQARDWTARLLSAPFGVALVVFVGLIALAIGVGLAAEAYTAHFRKRLRLGELRRISAEAGEGVVLLGRFGLGSLAVVFGLIGTFLIVAALHHDPTQAHGLGGSLVALAQQPYGHLALAIVAIGFVAYGFYSFAEARYRTLG